MKRWIRKIRGLSPDERRLLGAVCRRLLIARFLTKYLNYKRWNKILKSRLTTSGSCSKPIDPKTVEWALQVAARRFPGIYTCLPQAIAGCWTLRKSGVDAEIKIGVRRDDNGDFAAHAWVEVDDQVVIGDLPNAGGLEGFSHLMDLNKDQNP